MRHCTAMKIESKKPILLLAISGIVLCLSIVQGIHFVYLSYWIPSHLDVELSVRVWIAAKILVCLYLVISCLLIFRRQRLGVYLVELAVLFSLVYYVWTGVIRWFYLSESVQPPTPLSWGIQLAILAIAISGHVLYLWCLRNEKAILYFKLDKRRDA